eukprot:360600-Chlamydomonas_euryale.AAC.4
MAWRKTWRDGRGGEEEWGERVGVCAGGAGEGDIWMVGVGWAARFHKSAESPRAWRSPTPPTPRAVPSPVLPHLEIPDVRPPHLERLPVVQQLLGDRVPRKGLQAEHKRVVIRIEAWQQRRTFLCAQRPLRLLLGLRMPSMHGPGLLRKSPSNEWCSGAGAGCPGLTVGADPSRVFIIVVVGVFSLCGAWGLDRLCCRILLLRKQMRLQAFEDTWMSANVHCWTEHIRGILFLSLPTAWCMLSAVSAALL